MFHGKPIDFNAHAMWRFSHIAEYRIQNPEFRIAQIVASRNASCKPKGAIPNSGFCIPYSAMAQSPIIIGKKKSHIACILYSLFAGYYTTMPCIMDLQFSCK
jgi:hypothetical protein